MVVQILRDGRDRGNDNGLVQCSQKNADDDATEDFQYGPVPVFGVA